MTIGFRNGEEAPFNAWVRSHPDMLSHKGIAFCDCDMTVQRFLTDVQYTNGDRLGSTRRINHLMDIEVKTFGRSLTSSQEETLRFRHHALTNGKSSGRCFSMTTRDGKPRWVRTWGHFPLILEEADPSSGRIWWGWDRREIDPVQLVDIFWFRLHPVTLKPRTDRLHHAKRAPLFDRLGSGEAK